MVKHIGSTLTGVLLVGALAVPAMAAHDGNPSGQVATYTYELDEVADNAGGADVDGSVRLTALPNGKVQVKVEARGLAPGLPHAQHIHSPEDGEALARGECPGIGADGVLDRPVDGLVDTVEGVPSYGLVRQSLTTTGDTSGDSALAVDRFPVADADGVLAYERTFTPTDDRVWRQLGDVEVVIHGIDLDDDGVYGGEAASSLDPDLPLEATIPVLCAGVNG